MKKLSFLFIVLLCFLCVGCAKEKKPEKVDDIKYSVVSDSEIPKELMELINEKKDDEFRLTYADGKELYLVVGYGKKDTTGYSVTIQDFYQTADSLYIDTNLLGPKEGEDNAKEPSYPWIVVKTAYTDMMVIFG